MLIVIMTRPVSVCMYIGIAAEPMGKSEEGVTYDNHTDVSE